MSFTAKPCMRAVYGGKSHPGTKRMMEKTMLSTTKMMTHFVLAEIRAMAGSARMARAAT